MCNMRGIKQINGKNYQCIPWHEFEKLDRDTRSNLSGSCIGFDEHGAQIALIPLDLDRPDRLR